MKTLASLGAMLVLFVTMGLSAMSGARDDAPPPLIRTESLSSGLQFPPAGFPPSLLVAREDDPALFRECGEHDNALGLSFSVEPEVCIVDESDL
jgi:hypothetical protein